MTGRSMTGRLPVCAAILAVSLMSVPGLAAQGTWQTTLQPRDLDGNPSNGPEAFYDTVLHITWLRDADAKGLMSWDAANAWAKSLVVGTVSGWRLPTIVDTGRRGCNWSNDGTDCGYNSQMRDATRVYSEMAHLWYATLGNKGYFDTAGNAAQPGWGLKVTGDFQKMKSYGYWSNVDYALDRAYGWFFGIAAGGQDRIDKHNMAFALPVHDGDVGTPMARP